MCIAATGRSRCLQSADVPAKGLLCDKYHLMMKELQKEW